MFPKKMIRVNSSTQPLLLPLIKAVICNPSSIISMQKSFIKAAYSQAYSSSLVLVPSVPASGYMKVVTLSTVS